MLMSNTQYGDIIMELMDDGSSAEKAVEAAETCYAIVARNTRCGDCKHEFCEGCKGETLPYETKYEKMIDDPEDFYATRNNIGGEDMEKGEAAKLVIEEIGKLGIQMAELAKKAKQEYIDTRQYILKKPNVENELALLRQKIERSFGKTELALNLLGEKSQGAQEINERIDELESKARGGGSIGSTIAEPTEEVQPYTPSYKLDDYDSQLRPRHDPYEYYEGKVIQGTSGGGLVGCIEIGEGDWRNSLQ